MSISEEEFYELLWFRSSMIFTPKERELIKNAKVAIIGVGGTGGIASEQLVRTGVSNITIADPDIFEWTNINRQHFCTISAIGKSKVDVAKSRLLDINPFLNIKTFKEGINKRNVREVIGGVDVVIDASDNKSAHYPLHRVAKELKIPIISRSHKIPNFTFGAEINLWDYRKDNIETREEIENSHTLSTPLEDITDAEFEEKDRRVHSEFNKIYRDIFKSEYSQKLLLSENIPPTDFFNEYANSRENLVQGTNWGPTVALTGIFFVTTVINIIIGSKDIFLGPISIKSNPSIPTTIEQREIK